MIVGLEPTAQLLARVMVDGAELRGGRRCPERHVVAGQTPAMAWPLCMLGMHEQTTFRLPGEQICKTTDNRSRLPWQAQS